MIGALSVFANDIENESYFNTLEKAEVNQIGNIIAKEGGLEVIEDQLFDIILANINKNVILDNFSALVQQLAPGGILLLSGLLIDDENDIHAHASKYPLIFNGKATRNNWICLRFSH